MKTKSKHLIILWAAINFASCVSVKQQTLQPVNRNLSSEYNPVSKALHPVFRVFRLNENSARLYIKLFTEELNFSRANKENVNKAVVIIHYDILNSYRDNTIIDSTTQVFNLIKEEKENSKVSIIDIKNLKQEKFVLQIRITDQYSGGKSSSFVDVDLSQIDGFQNYMSYYKSGNVPLFLGWTSTNQKILLENPRNQSHLTVKFYKADFPAALPPQTSVGEARGNLKPDSVWQLAFSGQAVFTAKRKGIYRFQSDTTVNQGYAVINFGKDFPLFQNSREMLEGLNYLLSTEELEQMEDSPNKKLELDNFWLKAAGSDDKAGELIRIWYSRATYANYYFSSYTEGWKTDRGMIYMVFGPPQTVNKTDGAERWTYSSRNGKVLNFIFVKKQNSVSDNHFVMQRDISYRNYWFTAVESWRKGNVYQYQ